MMKFGSASFRRWIVERLPSRRVQRLRSIVDVMDAHAKELVKEKIATFNGERQSSVADDDDGDVTDILSRLSKHVLPTCVINVPCSRSAIKFGRIWKCLPRSSGQKTRLWAQSRMYISQTRSAS